MIRVLLPTHLCRLAGSGSEVAVRVEGPVTLGAVLDALETQYPMLRGTIRDHATRQRRDFIRFFACGEDFSLEPADTLLPAEVARGAAPLRVVGAMAGG